MVMDWRPLADGCTRDTSTASFELTDPEMSVIDSRTQCGDSLTLVLGCHDGARRLVLVACDIRRASAEDWKNDSGQVVSNSLLRMPPGMNFAVSRVEY